MEVLDALCIQTSLVAAEASRHGPVSIHARMQPAAEVGGDYYDVIDLGDGRLAFVVADVAGKGLPAALLMTQSDDMTMMLVSREGAV
ncbi:MAG: hypothetical protein DMF94_02995 [Acidobacteria bacterium]|nr:MAG: hypothetical protein DMF94_02995 [Acidobacteriota bacterium]